MAAHSLIYSWDMAELGLICVDEERANVRTREHLNVRIKFVLVVMCASGSILHVRLLSIGAPYPEASMCTIWGAERASRSRGVTCGSRAYQYAFA